MSVVAWDGKTLAADRQMTIAGLCVRVHKIRQLPGGGTVIASTGNIDQALVMFDWYMSGADPESWPEAQSDAKLWCRLIVATAERVVYYEQGPKPIPVEEAFAAWGAGRDYALGALAMGADARRAVEIANDFSRDCGFGVEAYDLFTGNLMPGEASEAALHSTV